ncbi:MAG: type I-U CRISPR-associated protein Csb2 [Chloroflexi bacterium]|nr:type I-U CRISPR-associated protein Csb2 [Chloroflexota bacterium]
MIRYLCVSVTLLDPLFHGKRDGDQLEWPPSPMRLFQALLAGSRCGCHDSTWSQDEADAFHWLERQHPPRIIAPPAHRTTSYTLYVPNNDGDKEFERQERLTSKPVQAYQLDSNTRDPNAMQQILHYLWSIDEDDWDQASRHAQLLCQAARRIMALGWGIDQAVADGRVLTSSEAAALVGECWQPWRSHRPNQDKLRVPVQGSLDNLQGTYTSFLKRVSEQRYNPKHEFTCFNLIEYSGSQALPPRSYARFELPDGVAFLQQRINEVSAMLRSLCTDSQRYRNRQDFQQRFPETDSETYLAGHVNDAKHTPPRFSYLPLPTVGHEHADGLIRRLLIAEPYGGDGSYASWAQQRLRNQALRDNNGGERGLLLDLWRSTSQAMVDRYTGVSESWATVTPVVLPGFDDGNHAKAEKLFFKAMLQATIPLSALAEFTIRKAPFWPGSQHPQQYSVPAYHRHLPKWHVWLRFRKPIPGPLAIGAGRHYGLGLFASWPLKDRSS